MDTYLATTLAGTATPQQIQRIIAIFDDQFVDLEAFLSYQDRGAMGYRKLDADLTLIGIDSLEIRKKLCDSLTFNNK